MVPTLLQLSPSQTRKAITLLPSRLGTATRVTVTVCLLPARSAPIL